MEGSQSCCKSLKTPKMNPTMTDDLRILESLRTAFPDCAKPDHFTNYTHCEECLSHDEFLRSGDRESLRLEEVNNPGWDPLCFASPEGFCYYLPALVRFSLMPSPNVAWHFPQLLFHLTHQYERNRHLKHANVEQRQSIVVFLRHIASTKKSIIESYLCTKDLELAIRLWSDGS